jgi:hypothetical protein
MRGAGNDIALPDVCLTKHSSVITLAAGGAGHGGWCGRCGDLNGPAGVRWLLAALRGEKESASRATALSRAHIRLIK